MPEDRYIYRDRSWGGHEVVVRSKGQAVKVEMGDADTVSVGTALHMAGALIRSALQSALFYSEGVSEKYLTNALVDGGGFMSGKAQELLLSLHSPEHQESYNRGFKDGYDLGHKHGFDN